MSDLEREINRAVERFVEQITELARDAALETLQSAFAGPVAIGTTVRQVAFFDGEAPRDHDSARRRSKDLESLAERLTAFIHANPGLRIDQISERLGTTREDLALPLRKLMAKGVIRIMGPNRLATYYTVRPERAAPSSEFCAPDLRPEPASQPPLELVGERTLEHVNGTSSANEFDSDWYRCLAGVFTFARKLEE